MDDSFLPGLWEIPGGKLEFGEKIENGVKREIEEETGMKTELIEPISVVSWIENNKQYVEIDYLCKPLKDIKVKLSFEHSDYKWVAFDELHNYEMSPLMKEVIHRIKSRKLPAR